MTKYRVLPYRQGSKSAKVLATALGGKVLKLEGSTFVAKPSDTIVNWGNANWLAPGPNGAAWKVLNHPYTIPGVSNKLKFFELMKEKNSDLIPQFWTSRLEIPDSAYPIVCRTILAGHSGAGIVIADSADQLVDAGLYVRYVKKQEEYRVHVGRRFVPLNYNAVGQPGAQIVPEYTTIAVQRKAKRNDITSDTVNWRVRNHDNGFVFVRQGVSPPAGVVEGARDALGHSGLDFGAVDVIWNKQEQRAYVLEINTAPGLEGQTVQDYAAFFKGVSNA